MSGEVGGFTGYGSTFGNVDWQGDVVMPGAFKATLPTFRKTGAITWKHDLGRLVAYPTIAREDDHGLYIEARFHTSREGQDAQAVVAERKAAGLEFGLSIGYSIVKSRMVGPVRQLLAIELFEVGLVLVPANPKAGVVSASAPKGMFIGPAIPLAPVSKLSPALTVEIGRALALGVDLDGTRKRRQIDALEATARRLGVRI